MSLVWAVYVLLPLITAVIDVFLIYWIHVHQSDVRGAHWFVATLAFGIVWMAAHLAMLVSTNPTIEWISFDFATKAATASFLTWAVFASRYSHADFHGHPVAKAGFGLAGLSLLIPSFLDTVRPLLYDSRVHVAEPFSYVAGEPGPLYVAIALVLLGLTAVGLFSLVEYLLSTPRETGGQVILLVAGSLSIGLASVIGDLGVLPAEHLNHTAYGALAFSVCTTLALFRFRLFEMQPVARNAVFETLRDPVFVLDDDRRLVDYNRAAAKLVPGVEGASGQDLATIHPDLAEAATRSDGADGSTRFALGEDDVRHYSVNVSRVGDDAGAETGEAADWYAVVLRDVTDLERSRWQLQAQNQRLDQVAATISHDLRNPINVADGYAELVDDVFATDDIDPAAREHLERVRGAHDRMGEIIDDVLRLAREGKTVEETESVALSAVAGEAWDNVATEGADLTVDPDGTVEADPTRLKSLFENLFRNAHEHVGPDVRVTVGTTDEGFFVADDGPGIPPEDADTVFEYGYTTSDDGTGLGLSIVRTIAESHGWTVELDDEYADGARFLVGTAGRDRGAMPREEAVLSSSPDDPEPAD